MFPHFLVAIADLTHPLSNNRSSVRIIGCSKPKNTTRVRVLQPARFGYTGANGNEVRQIQNKQVDNSSLDQTKPKTIRLQKRVSCGMVLMASNMLHEKCCNTVLQIGAPLSTVQYLLLLFKAKKRISVVIS